MKKFIFIPLSLLLLMTFSCKKETVKRQIDGYWVATAVSVNGDKIPLDKKYTEADSLDWEVIRDVRFYEKVKRQLDPTKSKKDVIYKGYFEGSVIQEDDQKVNTYPTGILFYFDYDITGKDKVEFNSISYGDNSMVKKSMPKEIEADLDFSKDEMTLEIPVGDDNYSFTFERK